MVISCVVPKNLAVSKTVKNSDNFDNGSFPVNAFLVGNVGTPIDEHSIRMFSSVI